jgi:hypothetical protein
MMMTLRYIALLSLFVLSASTVCIAESNGVRLEFANQVSEAFKLSMQGKSTEALSKIELLPRPINDSEIVHAASVKAQILMGLEKFHLAAIEYREILKLGHRQAREPLAYALYKSGKSDEAYEELAKVVARYKQGGFRCGLKRQLCQLKSKANLSKEEKERLARLPEMIADIDRELTEE